VGQLRGQKHLTVADEPEAPDPGRQFAELMSGAAAAAAPPADPEAPFGWTTDLATGERRPKKAAGRPRKSPTIDELKASREEGQAAASSSDVDNVAAGQDDRPPSKRRRRKRDPAAGAAAGDDAGGASQHRPGVITKGVNKLYRRAGKIVKAMDRDIGIAIIESTRNTDEDGGDDSVGAAWEEVCRTNPRIRRFVLRCIAGGAWGQLVMAHAPIAMAIGMKDGIRKHIPFARLIEALAEPDEDATPAEKDQAMTPADVSQMMDLAAGMMAKMGMGMPAPAAGGRRGPAPAPEAEGAAA
jgi:hypothetical protein